MTVDEVREKIAGQVAAAKFLLPSERGIAEFACADRILAAVGALFTDAHEAALREANHDAVHSYIFPREMREGLASLSITITALRAHTNAPSPR
jgi:hypothetical protein